MMDAATLSNILSWSIQVAAITVVAALVPLVLHVDAPAIRHGWWRAVLLSCLLLPILQPWQALSTFPIDVPTLDMTPTLTGSGKATLNASGSASLLSQSWQRTWPTAVGVVLIAGALVRLLWLAGGLFRLRRLRAAGSAADVSDGHRELAALTAAGAEIRYVPVIGQPMTFGIRRPVVLLPESLRTLPDPIQRAVLAHELWHVQRRDWLWILAEETLRSVLWFHPAIGYLVSRVQASREEVVDELTVLVTNARRSYIEALLAFADEPPLFAAAPFARRRHLFQRMLLISREAVMSSRRIVASTAVMTLAVVLTGWYGVAAFPLTSTSSGSQFELRTLPVSGQFQNASLRNVLAFMGKHAGVTFSYDQTFVDRTVTIEFRNASFLNALDRVLETSGYSYRAMSPTTFLIVKHNAVAGQQAPPRDLRPGQAAPPTNREVELQKAIDAGTALTVEAFLDLAKMQEQRGALSEAEATLLASRRVAGADAKALPALAAFYRRTNQFDKAVAVMDEMAAADPTNPKVHLLVATYYWEKAFKDPSLTTAQKTEYIQSGINATDRALSYDAEYVEALTYKNILLRMQANLETDRSRQAQLIAAADALRNKAMELNKARGGVSGGVPGGVPGGVAGGVGGSARSSDMPPPPPPPPPPGPPVEVDGQAAVRVGGNIAPPTKVKDVRPVYPPEAMGAKVQGVVILEAVIDGAGDVRSAKVLRSIPILDEAAVAAVEQWKFVPTLLNGVAVPVVMTVTVNFTLQ